jgi:hypothetical protein
MLFMVIVLIPFYIGYFIVSNIRFGECHCITLQKCNVTLLSAWQNPHGVSLKRFLFTTDLCMVMHSSGVLSNSI